MAVGMSHIDSAITTITTNVNILPIVHKLAYIMSSIILLILIFASIEISKFLRISSISSYIRSNAYIVSSLDGPCGAAARGTTFLAGVAQRTATVKQRACWMQVHSRTMNKQHIFFIMLVFLNL
jgi:hypothetical protein